MSEPWYMKVTGYSLRNSKITHVGKIHKVEYWARGSYVNRAFQQVNFMARDVFEAMRNRFVIYVEAGFNERNLWLSKTWNDQVESVASHLGIPVRAVPIPFRHLLIRKASYATEDKPAT